MNFILPNFASLSSFASFFYIFSEAIASGCSSSHMAPHVYWFLCRRTRSRHGPWNSLFVYLGETIGVQPTSTRRLALGFTSCYRFSPCYTYFTCRNFICQHSLSIAETTIKHRLLAFISFDLTLGQPASFPSPLSSMRSIYDVCRSD